MRHVAMVWAATAMTVTPALSTTFFTTDFNTGYETYLEVRGGLAVVEPGKFGTSTNAYFATAVTHDTDYLDGDWTATVEFGTQGNREYNFVCAGIGDPVAVWGADPNITSFYARGGNWYANQDMAVLTWDTSGSLAVLEAFTGKSAYGGTLTVTKSGDNLTFDMVRTGGTYSSGPWSISTNASWLDDTNSRFFIGASDPDVWVTSVSIIPEPATIAVLALGGLAGLIRRT